jgi:hypothetical protein
LICAPILDVRIGGVGLSFAQTNRFLAYAEYTKGVRILC